MLYLVTLSKELDFWLIVGTFYRFLLQLLTSSNGLDCMATSLNIIETNPFKHLIHLSLKLVEGSDSDVKTYLATCIKSLKVSLAMFD